MRSLAPKALLLLLASAPASAAKLPNAPGQPWPYFIYQAGPTAAGMADADVVAAIHQAVGAWGGVACSYLGFSDQGRTPSPGSITDSQNVMGILVEKSTDLPPAYTDYLQAGAIVAAAEIYTVGSTLQGCDVFYNAVSFAWSSSGAASTMDFVTVSTHEIGHCLGLLHDDRSASNVMASTVTPGELRRVPTAMDAEALAQLYPKADALGCPCAGTCAGGLSCISPASGPPMCSRGCDPAQPGACPAGFVCAPSSQIVGFTGACEPGSGPAPTPVGSACAGSPDCVGGQCRLDYPGGYCTQDCASSSCPSGALCLADTSLSPPVDRCFERCAVGQQQCRPGYACMPITALSGICVPACGATYTCPTGFSCRSCEGVCYADRTSPAAIGSPCRTGDECPTGGLCAQSFDAFPDGYCTQTCALACGSSCPVGTSCVQRAAGAVPLCMKECAQGDPAGCRTGYTCWMYPEGNVCEAPCSSSRPCPVGLLCGAGACVRPRIDGGPEGDGGDAGAGGDVRAGCGCGGEGGGLALQALSVLWFLCRRGRRWEDSRGDAI